MTAVTTRSAAPTNSEGSEDAFSSAQVPYSLPSDRRQKTAKKASYVISTALPTPVRNRCYFECTDSATMPGPGTSRMVAIWMSQEGPARRCQEGLRKHNARSRPIVSNKILGFLETPFNRLASRGRPDRDVGLSRRNPAFMTQRLWI
jgi:hypothetical protein